MERVLSESKPKARKNYRCDACDWLFNTDFQEAGLSFAEYRSIVKAKRNGYEIVKGQTYIKQSGVYEGELCTFRAIPEIHDICLEYGFYDH